MSLRSSSSALPNNLRKLVEKRASLPLVPTRCRPKTYAWAGFGSTGGLFAVIEELIEWAF